MSRVFENDPIPNLNSLKMSGISWSDLHFFDQYLTQHPLLEVIEFDASDMDAAILRQVMAILRRTCITELRVYDLDPSTMPSILVDALKHVDCKLTKCKVIQPQPAGIGGP